MRKPFIRVSVVQMAMCGALMAVLALFALSVSADASELVVRCTDADGTPVWPDRAELLMSGWGYADIINLKTSGNAVSIPLDEDRLSALAGEGMANVDELFLYIEAAGYAPVRSAPFGPPGKWAGSPGEAGLSFPGGESMTLSRDKTMEAVVVLRRPVKRSLMLVDEDGPAKGVTISTYMYWSSSNHCARLSGARLLDTTASGGDGMVEVPDGDFEYAFEIAADDMGLVLRDPKLSEYPGRLITSLKDERTVVKLHRRKSVKLTMRVTKNGVPAAGEALYGCMADCPGGVCASCCGPLATAGPDGVINLPVFYPEAYKSIYVPAADGSRLFEADLGKLSLERPIEVDLGACARQGGRL